MNSKLRLGSVLFAWAVFGLAASAQAGEPYLVADVVTTAQGSNPNHFVAMGDKIYFSANHPLTGRELWMSDGTDGGTRLLKDIFPGQGNGNPESLTVYDSRLWFVAMDPVHGYELWVSDGTEAGTKLAADVVPGPAGSGIIEMVVFADRLWFVAGENPANSGLWVSDGTWEGAEVAVQRVGNGLAPRRLTVSSSRLYFSAYTAEHGRELWSNDGTLEGTQIVADVNPGPTSGLDSVARILARDDQVYFEAYVDSSDGLWKTDGTSEGTVRIDLTPAGSPTHPGIVGLAGDYLVFHTGSYQRFLWATKDGTSFESLRDLRRVRFARQAGNELVFQAENDARGRELWRTDGTFEGTQLVFEGIAGGGSSEAQPLAFEEGRLWLQAYVDHSYGLWTTDLPLGGEARLLARFVNPVLEAVWFQNRMWFDGDQIEHGRELWSSDGTPEGTALVRDVNDLGTGTWNTGPLVPLDDRVVIFTFDELWVSDGTAEGTVEMAVPELDRLEPLLGSNVQLGGRIFFKADVINGGVGIWWSDGEQSGVLTHTAPGEERPRYLDFESTGRQLVFASAEWNIVELWGSDGEDVVRLTGVVRDENKISGGPSVSALAEVVPVGDQAIAFVGGTTSKTSRSKSSGALTARWPAPNGSLRCGVRHAALPSQLEVRRCFSCSRSSSHRGAASCGARTEREKGRCA